MSRPSAEAILPAVPARHDPGAPSGLEAAGQSVVPVRARQSEVAAGMSDAGPTLPDGADATSGPTGPVAAAIPERDAAKAASTLQSVAFLTTIHHEVRTPLNAIVGFAEIMVQGMFGPIGNERYQQYLSDIATSARRLDQLVQDALRLAELRTAPLAPGPSFDDVNLLAIAEDVAQQAGLVLFAQEGNSAPRRAGPGQATAYRVRGRRDLLDSLLRRLAFQLRAGQGPVLFVIGRDLPGMQPGTILVRMEVPHGAEAESGPGALRLDQVGIATELLQEIASQHGGALRCEQQGTARRYELLLPAARQDTGPGQTGAARGNITANDPPDVPAPPGARARPF